MHALSSSRARTNCAAALSFLPVSAGTKSESRGVWCSRFQWARTKFGAGLGVLAVVALTLSFGVEQASAQTRTPGIDVSRFQGNINWTSVRNSGVRYAFAQATRGLTSPNANFVANMNNGKAAGVYMSAYHYAFPADSTPEVQADHYWNLAGPHIKADAKSMMPMLDMEVWTGFVGATSYTDWANKWCNRIIAKAAAQGVVVKPIIYSNACGMCNLNSGISQWGAFVANYNGQNPNTGTPWSACSSCNRWGTWHFWQYTDTGSVPGISGNCDKDMFNGSVTTLVNNWVATSTGNPPPPPPGGVTVDNSNSGFSASSNWSTGTSAADKFGSDYRFHNTEAVSDLATWNASLNSSKNYNVYAWWSQGSNRTATASYTVVHSSGSTTVQKNQQTNGGSWQLLGNFHMNSGSNQVRLSCWTTTGFVVIADAIKWE
jgi:GH25 family lysozyme M1 (1,4-beta-N-acetylmuramidase)